MANVDPLVDRSLDTYGFAQVLVVVGQLEVSTELVAAAFPAAAAVGATTQPAGAGWSSPLTTLPRAVSAGFLRDVPAAVGGGVKTPAGAAVGARSARTSSRAGRKASRAADAPM